MRILALDLGTRSGWALWNGSRRESGVQIFDVKRGESPGMRYVRFRRWLEEIAIYHDTIRARVFPVDLIIYEQTHNRGGAATEVAAGFATRVQEFCAERSTEHFALHTATLKKWTTGKGNAKKPEMVAAVQRRFPASSNWGTGTPIGGTFTYLLDDNEADAIALLEYARAELVPQELPA